MLYCYEKEKFPEGPQGSVFRISGPDAADFLHRLTTAQVRQLEVGQGVPACCLESQGRIRAVFTLWRTAPAEFLIELDAGSKGQWKTNLLTLIDQFTFGEQLTVDSVPDWGQQGLWIFADPSETEVFGGALMGFPVQSGQTQVLPSGIRVFHQGSVAFGKRWFTLWGSPEALADWKQKHIGSFESLTESQLEHWRILQTTPRVDAEITPTVTPLEVGLRSSIADHKGCYPGQEVIERTLAMGSPSRRLVRLEGVGRAPQKGEPLFNLAEPPVAIGEVTSVAQDGAQFVALARVKKIHARPNLPVQFAGHEPAATQGRAHIVQVVEYQ